MATTASRWIDRVIDAALQRAFDQIDRYQREGYCTEEEVTEALTRGWDEAVADAWREYIEEEN